MVLVMVHSSVLLRSLAEMLYWVD